MVRKKCKLFQSKQKAAVDSGTYDRRIDELITENKQLKSQQFKPSWNDAPDWAEWLAQNKNGGWDWFEDKPKIDIGGRFFESDKDSVSADLIKNWQQTLEQRPQPPMPQVKVGQVWRDISSFLFHSIEFEVINVFPEINCKCDAGYLWSGALSDFLAKFERVS